MRGRGQGRGLCAIASQGQGWEGDQPEPVTVLDKDVAGHRLFEAGSPHAGRWAVRLMKTVSGDDYIVPSDYGLGEISRLHDRLWREEWAF